MTILDEIILNKRQEVDLRMLTKPLEELQKSSLYGRQTLSLAKAIEQKKGKAVIAEFKRKSPSKGIINSHADAVQTASGYASAGTTGISVLTDEKFFGGTPDDLTKIRLQVAIPLLRKDFIIDPFQVFEAKALGADVILLIAACLSATQMHELSRLAQSLGLETLFEIHDATELDKLPVDAKLVGINNRNLKSFEVSLEHSQQICKLLPSSCLKIAESGIHSIDDARCLADVGFDAFLIGEYFMKHSSPQIACKHFIDALK